MNIKSLKILTLLCLTPLLSYSQDPLSIESLKGEMVSVQKEEPHRYGGYYCPDNLHGFPAVDIEDWESVPVVNGRMATKEETQNGTSLINVDLEKYPNAKPLDMEMPKLARFYNRHSGKVEIIIVIQALHISNDSIVGFRYLNGGNGSARLGAVKMLSDKEIETISSSHFVTLSVEINTPKTEVWNVLTKPEYSKALQATFDKENKLKDDWSKSSKVNFIYPNGGIVTSEFAGDVWGNYYIQIDCELDDYQYVEKFILLENEEAKTTKLHIVCGPYGDDFKDQKAILNKWAKEVKKLSESI